MICKINNLFILKRSKPHGTQMFLPGIDYQKHLAIIASCVGYELKNSGKFDDVGFRVSPKHGQEEVFLFQCKHHKDFENSLNFSEFSKGLIKLYESFEEFINNDEYFCDAKINFHYVLIYNIAIDQRDSIRSYVTTASKPNYFPFEIRNLKVEYYALGLSKFRDYLKEKKIKYNLECLEKFISKFILITGCNIKSEHLSEYGDLFKRDLNKKLNIDKYSRELFEQFNDKCWMEKSEIKMLIDNNLEN